MPFCKPCERIGSTGLRLCKNCKKTEIYGSSSYCASCSKQLNRCEKCATSLKASNAQPSNDAAMLSAFARQYWKVDSGIRCLGSSANDIQIVVARAEDAAGLPTEFTYKGKTKTVSAFTGSSDLTADNAMRKWIIRGQGGKIVGHQG